MLLFVYSEALTKWQYNSVGTEYRKESIAVVNDEMFRKALLYP